MSNQPIAYGGQAVIEGVMFGGRYAQVTAIRRKNGEIQYFEIYKKTHPVIELLKKIPLLRGIVILIESMAHGSKHLKFASDYYELDHDESSPHPKEIQENHSYRWMIEIAIIGIISFIIGKVLFTTIPAFLSSLLFDGITKNLIIQNLIEGTIKTILLISYLYAISHTPLIKRVFQYHGAEHKVISAYENGEELTVKNVQKYSTYHYRCGSSFLILSIIVGVIVYSFFSYESVWDRILIRLELLPFVIGLSYELLRITNALRNIPILKALGYPGIWLQKLTTHEPTDEQVEVAIAAFKRLQECDLKKEAHLSLSQPQPSVLERG